MNDHQQFVDWFRHASPYIHSHRGDTFVISFAGEAVDSPGFSHIIHDTALLNSLGIHVVLVHGTRPQIERTMKALGMEARYAQNIRVTDEAALDSVKATCGQISTDIQALLSMGLADSPLSDAQIRVSMGNFVTAKPVGVRDGIDFMRTGEVRRVDGEAIKRRLADGDIVLISPLGYSPTGEIFNLALEDVAAQVAIALKAEKWVSLSEVPCPRDTKGELASQMTVAEAQRFLETQEDEDTRRQIRNAIRACQQGVHRVQLVERSIDGGVLLELFTRDGVGTLVSHDAFENMRRATVNDIAGIIQLIEPLENAGVLVRRSREKLETEISHFVIQERDGLVLSCAALYPYPDADMAELGCVAVNPKYRGGERGDALLAFMERETRLAGISQIFVLTTQTAHWFQERGFVAADIAQLPLAKRELYNLQRNSKIFIKQL